MESGVSSTVKHSRYVLRSPLSELHRPRYTSDVQRWELPMVESRYKPGAVSSACLGLRLLRRTRNLPEELPMLGSEVSQLASSFSLLGADVRVFFHSLATSD